MAQASGKRMVLDRNTDGKSVSVVFSEPLPKQEAYARIVTPLKAQGLKVKDEGEVVRISR